MGKLTEDKTYRLTAEEHACLARALLDSVMIRKRLTRTKNTPDSQRGGA